MHILMTHFRFGNYKSLKVKGGSVFNSRQVEHRSDWSIKSDMADYIMRRLKEIAMTESRILMVCPVGRRQWTHPSYPRAS